MQNKSFDEIAAQNIAEVATVNRATFYDRYTDQCALLDAMVAGRFHAITGNVPFPMRDVVLLTASFYLLNQDVLRVLLPAGP